AEIRKPLPMDMPPREPGSCGTPGKGMPGPKKRRKNSGMSSGSACAWRPPRGPMTTSMLTTAGATRSTSRVKSGRPATSGVAAGAVTAVAWSPACDCADWAVATGTTTAAVPAAVRATRRSDWTGSFIGEGPRLRGLGWGGAGRGPGPGSTGGAGGRARGLGALQGDLADAGPLDLRAGRRRRAQAAEPRLERGECLGLCQPVAGGEGLARGQPG